MKQSIVYCRRLILAILFPLAMHGFSDDVPPSAPKATDAVDQVYEYMAMRTMLEELLYAHLRETMSDSRRPSEPVELYKPSSKAETRSYEWKTGIDGRLYGICAVEQNRPDDAIEKVFRISKGKLQTQLLKLAPNEPPGKRNLWLMNSSNPQMIYSTDGIIWKLPEEFNFDEGLLPIGKLRDFDDTQTRIFDSFNLGERSFFVLADH